MTLRTVSRLMVLGLLLVAPWGASSAAAQQSGTTRVVGVVRDEINGITLPGVPVELVGSTTVVYTDVDGRYLIDLPPGKHELRVVMENYDTRTVTVQVAPGDRAITADLSLRLAAFRDEVTVTAEVINVDTSTAQAQLQERRQAPVITDNVGAQEMRRNADSDAAAAMSRVTGLSVVDNQYVFVRGLGERYSNTTLAGAVLPTTEPDKKVVPLDLFPTGLLDSVQVSKTYSVDRSAEFAGGLVQIIPLKLPNRPVIDMGYKLDFNSISTGEDMPQSPLGSRDWWGYDNGARALPASIPNELIVREGIYTSDELGFPPEQITEFGRALENIWTPEKTSGSPGGDWNLTFGNRYDKFGVIASITHQYRERFVEEQRRFYRVGEDDALEPYSDYAMQYGTQKGTLGIVGNLAYQVTPNNRLIFDNFYTHSGRDEGRTFEGPNFENAQYFRNSRVQFIEEGLLSSGFGGEHFLQGLSNSRLDWRVTLGNATRNEPDLRETLYQSNLIENADGTFSAGSTFLLADESQSGYRMFNDLEDDTVDVAANWSVFRTAAGRPTQLKFGMNYVDRSREFTSRRFRFIPISPFKDGPPPIDLSQTPEALFASQNIGTAFRFNEETKPVDAYDATQETLAVYGMADVTFSSRTRLIAGLRVEDFQEQVDTLDRFALVPTVITARIDETDFFPSVNFVQGFSDNLALRLGYSTTVNRPEFRELAEFEFTDVVGNRAVKGNPELTRALVQNVDARVEAFSGARGILAGSVFYKYFDQPIERVVIASAQPLASFQNAESARNFGFEFEVGRQLTDRIYVNANYTYVSSEVTLRQEQFNTQTSTERPLAGQSDHLFNVMGEYAQGGFSGRVLYNFMGDRISDVGSSGAPDVIEEGRGTLDVVVLQRLGRLSLRVSLENLTDEQYTFTQGGEDQRTFKLGRTFGIGVAYSIF